MALVLVLQGLYTGRYVFQEQISTSSTLWANSANVKLMIFSSIPRKVDFTFHANCLQIVS